MNYVNLYKLKPGDKIIVPKSWMNLVQHHVVFLGPNHMGIYLVAENAVGMSVRIIPAEQFFQENPTITRIERFVGNNIQRRQAIERALEKLGQPYDLINFNCEHFATYVQTGIPSSKQVGWGILAAALLALVVFSD